MLEGSKIWHSRISFGLLLIAQLIKNPLAMQETPIQFLGRKDPLEKGGIGCPLQYSWASLVAQLVKNLPTMWETWVQSLEKGTCYPLQYSGLENSMDCIVHGVTKNQTGLSDFHFPYSILCLGYNGLLCFHLRSFLCPYPKFNQCLDRNVYLSFVKLPLICADKLDNSLFIYFFLRRLSQSPLTI